MSRGFYVPCAPFLYLVPDSAAAPGMELQQRSPGPFHYLINEQAKSLVALQELQNEVGALLEFRDLVMDTFPHLRTKMAPAVTSSTASPSPPSHIPIPLSSASSSLNAGGGRREWEPGIRVRRKIPTSGHAKDHPLDTSLTTTRRKPLSHQPKSGDTLSAGSSAVQDSGFSTETSSTKETPEVMTSPPKEIPSTGSGISSGLDEAEDELWNLLDVIHRKGTKLREEVECLQDKLNGEREEKRLSKDVITTGEYERLLCKTSLDGGEGLAFLGDLSDVKDDEMSPRIQQEFKPGGSMRCVMEGADLTNNLETNIKEKFRNSKLLLNLGGGGGGELSDDVDVATTVARELKFERDYLLDKLAEMEAETLATRARASQLKTEVTSLVAAKRDLEEQLRTAVTQKSELNTRIHDLHIQFVGKPVATSAATASTAAAAASADNKKLVLVPSSRQPLPNQQGSFIRPPGGTHPRGPSCFAPVQSSRTNIPKSSSLKSMPSVTSPQNSVTRVTNVTDAFAVDPAGGADSKSELRISNDTDDVSEVRVSARTKDEEASLPRRSEVRLKVRLGTLDGVVSDPASLARCGAPDRRKVAAILGEFNPLELQRHLLATCVENQDLHRRLTAASASHASLQLQADKVREDNDELRFQLEKRSIELEGTRAQVRVLERLQNARPSDNVAKPNDTRTSFVVADKSVEVPRNKLSYDVHSKLSYDVHHSSTESSHDVVTTRSSGHGSVNDMSSVEPAISPIKKRPSKIPLGTKLYTAPRPPAGKGAIKVGGAKDNRDNNGSALVSLGKGSVGRNSSLSQKNSLNGRSAKEKRDSLGNGGKMNSFGSNASKNSLGSTGRRSVTQRGGRTGVARSNTVVIDHGNGGDGNNGSANGKITTKPADNVTPFVYQQRSSQIPVHSTPLGTRQLHTTVHPSRLLRSTLLQSTPANKTPVDPTPINTTHVNIISVNTTPVNTPVGTPQHYKSTGTTSPPYKNTFSSDRTPTAVRTPGNTAPLHNLTPTPPRLVPSRATDLMPEMAQPMQRNCATRQKGATPRSNSSLLDAMSTPWLHSSSEYYDSIDDSSLLDRSSQLHSCHDSKCSDLVSKRSDPKSDRSDLVPDTTQLHSCTDLPGECFGSMTQNEAMAEYDSLELDVPIRSGRLIMARNIWVTSESLDDVN